MATITYGKITALILFTQVIKGDQLRDSELRFTTLTDFHVARKELVPVCEQFTEFTSDDGQRVGRESSVDHQAEVGTPSYMVSCVGCGATFWRIGQPTQVDLMLDYWCQSCEEQVEAADEMRQMEDY